MHPQMTELMALLDVYKGKRGAMSASDGRLALRAMARVGHLGDEVDLVALSGLEDSSARTLLGGDFDRAWTVALGRLLRRLDAERIPAIGRQLRMSFTGGRDSRRSQGPPDWSFALAALYSMNWNGYVREDAVLALRSCVGQGEDVDGALPFLLARVFDWVDSVAKLAGDAFLGALPKASPAAVVKILPLVRRCDDLRRDRLGLAAMADIAGAVEARLDGADGMTMLRDGLGARSCTVRTECALELLGRGAEGAHKELLGHRDEAIRLRYLGWLSQGHAVPGQREQLLRLSEDPSPAVRAAALRAVAVDAGDTVGWEEVRERFLAALLDLKARSVRSIAQFHFRRHEPEFSFAALYRDTIAARRPGWQGAVDGLSLLAHTEAERESDDVLFLALMDEAAPGVVGRVIRARASLEGGRLGEEAAVDPELVAWLHGLLEDKRLATRSAASKAITQLQCPPASESLMDLARNVLGRTHARGGWDLRDQWIPLLRVSRLLEAWPRIVFLMSSPVEFHGGFIDRVNADLHCWLHQFGEPARIYYGSWEWRFPSLEGADTETSLFLERRLQCMEPFLNGSVVLGIRGALEQPPRGSLG